MKHRTQIIPGYDCPNGKCSDPKCTTRDHGIHGEEWIYSSLTDDGKFAVVLTVYTSRYPATVSQATMAYIANGGIKYPYGADISIHSAIPTQPEDLYSKDSADCNYVKPKGCYIAFSSGLQAREFFEQHDSKVGPKQLTGFWKALDKWLLERIATFKDIRKTHRLCPTCKGKPIMEISLAK